MKLKGLLKRTVLYKKYNSYRQKKYQVQIRSINDAFKEEAASILQLYSDALMEAGLVFWLDYGTLLGYYREHDFIKHDFDLDTSAWYEDHEKIKSVLENAGFELVRHYYLKNRDGLEECYKHCDYKTTIDVFYYFNENDNSYCFSFDPLVSMTKKRHLNKIQKSKARKWTFPHVNPVLSNFKGIKVYVPEYPEKHLTATYGETFMTPIPNFPFSKRPNMTEYSYDEMPACAFLKVGYM